jgi:hypothetical protein
VSHRNQQQQLEVIQMKATTKLWMRLQNVGRPADTLVVYDSVAGCMKRQMEWALGIYMGSGIVVRYARTEDELNRMGTKGSQFDDIVGDDIESWLDGIVKQAEASGIVNNSEDESEK